MAEVMPQEIAVWYVIPSLRKELAVEILKEKEMTQKKAAKILGISEAAVSQYLKSKRAKEIEFSKDAKKRIKEAAHLIIKEPKKARTYIYRLSNTLMGSKEVCKLHMEQDKSVKKGCKVCFEN
jgi:uncharacterized protein